MPQPNDLSRSLIALDPLIASKIDLPQCRLTNSRYVMPPGGNHRFPLTEVKAGRGICRRTGAHT
jgi:hypothetical protein